MPGWALKIIGEKARTRRWPPIADEARHLYGVQFHPGVVHTTKWLRFIFAQLHASNRGFLDGRLTMGRIQSEMDPKPLRDQVRRREGHLRLVRRGR